MLGGVVEPSAVSDYSRYTEGEKTAMCRALRWAVASRGTGARRIALVVAMLCRIVGVPLDLWIAGLQLCNLCCSQNLSAR